MKGKFLAAAALAGAWLGASPTAAQAQGVRIGVLNDMSSVYADAGGKGAVEAAKMAAEDAGAILGAPVEIVSADHQNKPDIGGAIARQWYEKDGVDMITDVPNSAVGFAVSTIATQARKVALLTGSLSADLTGEKCSPYTAAWMLDSYSQSRVLGSAIVKQGGDTWFFLGADYGFGRALTRDATAVVEANGGKVLGAVYAPLNNADFSSFLLQAQQSKAKIIGLGNAAGDTANSIKQGDEFGIRAGGQKFAAFVIFILDVKALGLKAAQGLQLSSPFYWDMNDETRAFSKRFEARVGRPPTWDQAGVYSAIAHYLKAVKAVGSKDADKVMAKMRETPINDFASKNAVLRIDGRVVRDMHLFEVKKPEESKGPWDLYKLVATVPGADAFRPLSEGKCPLVAQAK
jgi:branched-chain amino acid transport system substrate-binding protein